MLLESIKSGAGPNVKVASGTTAEQVAIITNDEMPVKLLTGFSGGGKTRLASLIKKPIYVLNLDAYGDEIDGKWIIDANKVPQLDENVRYVLEGVSDNLFEVVADLQIKRIFIPVPTLVTFKNVMIAKADHGKTQDLPKAWVTGWYANAEFTPSQYAKYVKAKISLISTRCADSEIVVLVSTEEITDIKNGWHK